MQRLSRFLRQPLSAVSAKYFLRKVSRQILEASYLVLDLFVRSPLHYRTTTLHQERHNWHSPFFNRHLPAYLVAAFVKRMARLALTAPPAGALFGIAFVYNLLKRHPQCQLLVNRGASNEAPVVYDPNGIFSLSSFSLNCYFFLLLMWAFIS